MEEDKLHPVKLQNEKNVNISKALSELKDSVSKQSSEEQLLHGEMSFSDAYSTMNHIFHRTEEDLSTADRETNLSGGSTQKDISTSRTVRRQLPRGKVPAHISELIQQANTLYIQGEFDKTRDIILQVIKMRPNYGYPYSILASIAESDGDAELSLQCRIINALIDNEFDSWKTVMKIAGHMKRTSVQIYSLKRMANMKHHDEEFILADLTKIYLELKMERKAFKTLARLLRVAPGNEAAVLEFARLANLFEQPEKVDPVVIEYMKSKPITEWNPHIFNLKCELMIDLNGLYDQVIALIEDYANAHNVGIEGLDPDLILHYGRCLLHVHRFQEAEAAFQHILNSPLHNSSDFLPWIGVAYKQHAMYQEAIEIFRQVAQFEDKESQALYEIILCYIELNNFDQAIRHLEIYGSKYPMSTVAASSIINSLSGKSKQGRNRVMMALNKMKKERPDIDLPRTVAKRRRKGTYKVAVELVHEILLVVHEAEFAEKMGDIEKFIEILEPVYYACVNRNPRSRKDAPVYLTKSQQMNLEALKKVEFQGRKWKWIDLIAVLGESSALDLVLKLANALVSTQQNARGFFLLETMLKCGVSKAYLGNLKSFLIKLYMRVGKYKQAYRHLRYAITQDVNYEVYWGLIYVFIQKGMNLGSTFIKVLLNKNPDCVPAMIVLGHGSMQSGVDALAYGYYLAAYKFYPRNAIINLCLGAVLLNSLSKKRLSEKHPVVLNAFSFLYQYADVSRDYPMEVYYNLGRAFHQINLLSEAVNYYNKVLSLANNCSIEKDNLIREAAVNLSKIYADTGNTELATSILFQYVTI